MRRAVLVGLCVLLFVLVGVASPVAVSGAEAATTERTDDAHAGSMAPVVDGDSSTEIAIHLQEDRSARWVVTIQYTLESEAEVEAFQTYAESFENGDVDVGLDDTFFRHVLTQAEQVADREMEIQEVTRTGTVEDDTGTLQLELTWTNFLGQADNGDLVARDAFLLPEGGTWLATLDPDQNLVVHSPPGYTLNTTTTQVLPRGDAAVIEGPRSFDEGEPLVITYHPTDEMEFPLGLTLGGVITVAVILMLLVTVLYRQRNDSPVPVPVPVPGSGESEQTTPAPESGTVADAGPDGDDRDESVEGQPQATDDDRGVALDLLSDEERVEHLLADNGGRMKQAAIVRETGWSDAKVSQLLSAMADDGRVEKLRLGRENIISLPDDENADGESAGTNENGDGDRR